MMINNNTLNIFANIRFKYLGFIVSITTSLVPIKRMTILQYKHNNHILGGQVFFVRYASYKNAIKKIKIK